MTAYIVKRLIAMLVTLWLIITLTFFLMHSVPGSPFNEERATNETVQKNLEKYYHLDEPLIVQYGLYLKSVVTLDFGPSIKKSSQTVNEMLGRGFPVSFELGIVTLIVAVISGITLGIIAALRHNGDEKSNKQGIKAGDMTPVDEDILTALLETRAPVFSDVYDYSGMKRLTGYAPIFKNHDMDEPPVAKKVNGVVITSSPDFTPAACSAICMASLPFATPIP